MLSSILRSKCEKSAMCFSARIFGTKIFGGAPNNDFASFFSRILAGRALYDPNFLWRWTGLVPGLCGNEPTMVFMSIEVGLDRLEAVLGRVLANFGHF